MEGLIKRAWYLGGGLLLIGAAINFGPRMQYDDKTEDWMIQKAPDRVGELEYIESPSTPGSTYRMDDRTYETLRPYGIVARVYAKDHHSYDVVLIASRDKESFHDPRVCFSAQGWNLHNERTVNIETQTRGVVKATMVDMTGPFGKKPALYFYRGPGGFYPTPIGLKANLAWQQFMWKKDIDGVFYRIIPNNEHTTEEQLLKFVADYLEESNRTSEGYF
jgi:hypothetical protein